MFLNSNLEIICKTSYFFLQIPVILEIEILFTIALDRYSSVFKPIKLYFFDINKLIVTLTVQLVCASLLSLPNLLFITKNNINTEFINLISIERGNNSFISIYSDSCIFCKVNDKYRIFYSWYQCFLCLLFFINLFIISIFYIKVYKHIYKASKNQRLENANSSTSRDSRMSITLQIPVSHNTPNALSPDFYHTSSLTGVQLQKQHTLNEITTTTSNAQEHSSIINNEQETSIFNNQPQKIKNLLKNLKNKSSFDKPQIDSISIKNLDIDGDNNNNNNNNKSRRHSALNLTKIKNPFKSSLESRHSTNSYLMNTSPRRLSVPVVLSTPTTTINNKKIHHNEEKKSQRCKSLTPQVPNEIFNSQNRLFRRHISRPFKHGKTARILGISTLTLLLTWIPYWYYVILKESRLFKDNYDEDDPTMLTSGEIIIFSQSKYYLKRLLKNLFYLNYVLNPFFYSFVNHRFRQNVYNLFFKFHICKNLKIFQKFQKFKELNYISHANNNKKDFYSNNNSIQNHHHHHHHQQINNDETINQNNQLIKEKQQNQQQQQIDNNLLSICKTTIKEVDEISTKKNSFNTINNDVETVK